MTYFVKNITETSPPRSDWYNLNITSFHLKELEVYKLLCAETYEMKTNEVQKVSEHFFLSLISVSHLETTRIEGGRALQFFPQDPLEIFCCCEFTLKNPQSLFPDVFPQAFWNRPLWEFSHLPSLWSLPWHRLTQGVNPISWTRLSFSNSFLQHQLSCSGGLCLPALWAALCEGSSGSWFQPPAFSVYCPSSGP